MNDANSTAFVRALETGGKKETCWTGEKGSRLHSAVRTFFVHLLFPSLPARHIMVTVNRVPPRKTHG